VPLLRTTLNGSSSLIAYASARQPGARCARSLPPIRSIVRYAAVNIHVPPQPLGNGAGLDIVPV
jgi:hypothetical protein